MKNNYSKRSQRQKNLHIKCHFWQILNHIVMYWQVLVKISIIKFHENPSVGSRSSSILTDWPTDRRTDRPTETRDDVVSFSSCFTKAPETGIAFLTVDHKTCYTTRNMKINQEQPVFKNKTTGSAKRRFEPELNLCCHYIQSCRQTNIHVLVQ